MPSLRRSFSSPSVRSSPYSSSFRTRALPLHPRRTSPSATAERRVLADIEWWRVHDGQCDLDHTYDHPQSDTPPGGLVSLSAADPSQPHSLPSQDVFFNALSVAPYSPQGSRHTSVQSSPELSAAPLEAIMPGLADPPSCLYSDPFAFPSVLSCAAGRQAHPIFGLRSVSAPGLTRQPALVPDFADIGGDSFSLDQNLFQ